MKPHTLAVPQWSTAAFGTPADTLPVDLDMLRAHIERCTQPLRMEVVLQHGARVAFGFVTARVASSVLVLTLLLTVLAMLTRTL